MDRFDSSRQFLVTRFACAQCGGVMNLTYQGESRPKSGSDDGITGANKVEQVVKIWPCEKCYGEAIGPLQQICSALGIPCHAKGSSQ